MWHAMAVFLNQEFADEEIIVDGLHYVSCKFSRCKLRFRGKAEEPRFSQCIFDECEFVGVEAPANVGLLKTDRSARAAL